MEKYIDYLFRKVYEESGECIQAIAKLQTFGPESWDPATGVNNNQKAVDEIHDFLAAIEMLRENGLLRFEYDRNKIIAKKTKVIDIAIGIGIIPGVISGSDLSDCEDIGDETRLLVP